MISIITILIILACIVMAFFVLVQAPKGGGLTGNFGSLSTQVMGVKQSTDVMEKGTWTSIAVIAVLCIVLVSFTKLPAGMEQPAPQQQQQSAPAKGAAAPASQPAPAPQPAK